MITPRSAIDTLQGFKPGLPDKTVPELQKLLNQPQVDKLSFNESPYGSSPIAVAAIQHAAESLHLYHDPLGRSLKEKLAALYQVEPEMIILGSGADETISLLMQGFLNSGEEVIVQQPTFGQYAAAATLAGGRPVQVPVRADLTTDFDGMLSAITPDTKMIFICNPNNPTGIAEGKDQLLAFLQQVPRHILIVLDEAYAEYVGRADFISGISLLAEFGNLLVIRTFSKVYGLAGLRLGYGISQPELVSVIERVRNPFNVNSLALVGAEAALTDRAFCERVIQANQRQRARLTNELTALGWTVYPSDTSFLFADTGSDSAKLCQDLAAGGIIIRPGHGWARPSFVRISIGDEQQNERLMAALRR